MILGSLALVVLFLGLIWSGSSQGLIGLCITVAAFLIGRFVRSIRQRFSVFIGWLYGLGLAIFFLAIGLISISPNLNISVNPYLERLEIYQTGLRITVEHLLFGTGTDRFAAEYGKFTIFSDLKLVDNAHSIPIQIVSTQGLLGLLFFLTFVFWVLRLKEGESSYSNSYWTFWQASFFSFAVIGIIGIEHPVITSIGFLSAGVLSSISQEQSSKQTDSSYKVDSKFIHVPALVLSVVLSLTTYHFVNGELKAGNAISQLSQRKISVEEFEKVLGREYEKIYNARVLLNAGEAYIAIGNQVGALKVANTMLYRFPDDQRTSALFFSIAKTWNDEKAYRTATALRDQLFPKAKDD
jgi:tetratricopeptide (TPR) repeat protein